MAKLYMIKDNGMLIMLCDKIPSFACCQGRDMREMIGYRDALHMYLEYSNS